MSGAHPGRRGARDRARDREPARALDRRLLHPGPHARRGASRSTGPTPSPRSTRSPTTPACSRSPAPTSPPTAGARPSTPSRPGSWTARTCARELVPWGSAPSADLLNALDRRIQEGTLDPSALAPVARLMSAGSIVYRADLQTDRYNLARPVPLWQLLTEPRAEGARHARRSTATASARRCACAQDDEIQLALPAGRGRPAAGEHLPGRRHPADRQQRRRVRAAASSPATAKGSSTSPASAR